jgi:hypothetical protein
VNVADGVCADVPEVPDTVTYTVLSMPGGDTAVISLDETLEKLVADTVPKSTVDVPDRCVPVMVTFVPPRTGPDDGVIEVMLGIIGG